MKKKSKKETKIRKQPTDESEYSDIDDTTEK